MRFFPDRSTTATSGHHFQIPNMEESSDLSPVNNSCPNDGSACSGESSWTMYLEDFMASEERRAAGGFSTSAVSGNSMISDAASCVAWKPPPASFEVSEKYGKLNLKKRKGKGLVLEDDSLEDTASSPVNSPKIAEFTNWSLDSSKKHANKYAAQEDAVGYKSAENPNKNIVSEFDLVERRDECTELKKRGLCLVPLSMLLDHL